MGFCQMDTWDKSTGRRKRPIWRGSLAACVSHLKWLHMNLCCGVTVSYSLVNILLSRSIHARRDKLGERLEYNRTTAVAHTRLRGYVKARISPNAKLGSDQEHPEEILVTHTERRAHWAASWIRAGMAARQQSEPLSRTPPLLDIFYISLICLCSPMSWQTIPCLP